NLSCPGLREPLHHAPARLSVELADKLFGCSRFYNRGNEIQPQRVALARPKKTFDESGPGPLISEACKGPDRFYSQGFGRAPQGWERFRVSALPPEPQVGVCACGHQPDERDQQNYPRFSARASDAGP